MLSEKRKGHMGFWLCKNINEGVSRCRLFYAQKASARRPKTQQIGVVSVQENRGPESRGLSALRLSGLSEVYVFTTCLC